jgi:hypothetical protein
MKEWSGEDCTVEGLNSQSLEVTSYSPVPFPYSPQYACLWKKPLRTVSHMIFKSRVTDQFSM